MIKNFLSSFLRCNFSTIIQLGEKQYLSVAVKKIHELTEIVQQFEDKHNIDIASTDQVLKIHLNQHSIVVNTQTPNRQLWYSCTKSGPQRFDYVINDNNQPVWINNKGKELSEQLKQDLSQILF